MKLFQRKKNGPWWIDFTIGRTRVRRSLGVRDGKAASSLATELMKEYEERLAGTFDATKKHQQRPVEDHTTS